MMAVRCVYEGKQVGSSLQLTDRVDVSTDIGKGRNRPESFVGRDSGIDDDQLDPVL